MIIYDKRKPTIKKKSTRKSKLNTNTNFFIPIILAVVAIFGVIYFCTSQQNKDKYSNLKIYEDESLVFTRHDNEDKEHPIVVPYINIDSENIESINNEILDYAQSIANKKNNAIIYEYEINSNILSLVLKSIINNNDSVPTAEFKTYNINLDTIELITPDELLELFGVNYNQVEQVLESNFKKYYADEVKEGYINKSICDYECFLNWRGIEEYLDSVAFYVQSGTLIAYRPFVVNTILEEKDFYKEETFEFQITS